MTIGWLTPNQADIDGYPDTVRGMRIPVFLWRYVMGALWPLADEENWEQDGDKTPSEMAELFFDLLEGFDNVFNYTTPSPQAYTFSLVGIPGQNLNTTINWGLVIPDCIGCSAMFTAWRVNSGGATLSCNLVIRTPGEQTHVASIQGNGVYVSMVLPNTSNEQITVSINDNGSLRQVYPFLVGWI